MGLDATPVHLDLLNPGRSDAIAKLQEQTRRGEDVTLDRTATPGTTVDSDRQRCGALPVEPAT